MSIEVLTILLFGSLIVCMVTGFPIAFGLGGIGIIYGLWLWGPQSLLAGAFACYDTAWSWLLIAIPLFILMGNILAKSGVTDNLFGTLYLWLGGLRGGLAIALILVAAVIGAMNGLIGAAIVAMGIVAIPAMTKRNYDRKIIMGSLMAGGALSALIPPSVTMLVYASVSEISVGKLFMGGIIPGFILAGAYGLMLGIRIGLRPELGPPIAVESRGSLGQKVASLKYVILPIFLILAVLGSIFAGIATPTEASAVGVVGAIICAAVNRRLNWTVVKDSCYASMSLLGIIVWILIGATCFTRFYTAMGAAHLIEEAVMGLGLSLWWVLIGMQVVLILLGMIMEDLAIVMIAAPIFCPIVINLGFDPLWFAILFLINMQIAVLTPPYGFCLFYAKALVPEESMGLLWRSIIPFVPLQVAVLALCMAFPQLILWVPGLII